MWQLNKFKIVFMQEKPEQHSTGTYTAIIATLEIEADTTETAEMIAEAMKTHMPKEIFTEVVYVS